MDIEHDNRRDTVLINCQIHRDEPGAGTIITFVQFFFIAVEGFIFVSNFGQTKSKIPIRNYMTLVGLYFVVSVVNNFAFYFDIPLPLHMIFRAVRAIAAWVYITSVLSSLTALIYKL